MQLRFSLRKIFSSLKNRYLRRITIFLIFFSILSAFIVAWYDWIVGIVILLIAILSIMGSLNAMNYLSIDTHRYVSDLSYLINKGEQASFLKMPVGIIILGRHNQTIEWINPYLKEYFKDDDVLGKTLSEAAPGLKSLVNQYWDSNRYHTITWNHHHFTLLVQKAYRTVYLMDITQYYDIKQRLDASKLSIGEIFLDNYAEITQSMSDQAISNLHNYVTNELSAWAHNLGIYLKQIDDDHFMMLAYAKALRSAEENKFAILDKIRESTSKQNFPLTLSVGIAYGDNNLNHLSHQAQSDLDLALGRGGDQVVVKAKGHDARFYGGKTNPMEKRTRVRARMTSQALQELMKESDQVFVQGHMHPDMDALGACLGIHRIARMNNKKCWIVLNPEKRHSDVRRLLDDIKKHPDTADAFISSTQAMKIATDNSLLILVDHSKPSISISPKLCHRLHDRIMIVDHHRRGEEFPDHPILVYIEPYASSTCELVTEMVSYQSQDANSINRVEATAMLSGIVTDTQSFSVRTGTRTFDAASYLRSAGADVDKMHQFMQENVKSYLDRNHLISRVEFMPKSKRIALIIGEKDRTYDPVIAAQAADSLLTMSGVEASFVATKRPTGEIGISARSDGQFNVQLIMERLGGGGHLSSGATQIKGQSLDKIKTMLMKAIRDVDRQEMPSNSQTSAVNKTNDK